MQVYKNINFNSPSTPRVSLECKQKNSLQDYKIRDKTKNNILDLGKEHLIAWHFVVIFINYYCNGFSLSFLS